MPYLSEDKIASIVERVVGRLSDDTSGALPVAPVAPPLGCSPTRVESRNSSLGEQSKGQAVASGFLARGGRGGRNGVFKDIDSAVAAAKAAFSDFCQKSLETRFRVIEEIRKECLTHVERFSRDAVEETGLGRYDQKLIKNKLVIDKTPGPEILKPSATTGDHGLMLEEYAPYGVIGAITPTTNPTETIICNGIGMIAAGNAVVFNPHPGAKKVCAFAVERINEAIVRAGGPPNLMTCTAEPTIDSAQALMSHKDVRLLVVTGGPGVVQAAMQSGKKVIAGGPGNPPVVVDETADLMAAADGIVKGISLDNNIVCTAEKEIIAVASIADELKAHLNRSGAYELNSREVAAVEKVVIDGKGYPNKKWVGKDASKILAAAGVRAPKGTLVAYGEVSESHPFVQTELLMPITGLVRVPNVREAIACAVRCEHGNGHTAAMWSKNIDNLHAMACAINTSIFTKNAPTYAGLGFGGEGYTSFTIASPTGEGLTTALDFSRVRRCVLKDHFRIV